MDDGVGQVAWRIKLARLGRGWTQEQVGEKIGKSKDSVTQIESGRRSVSDETLRKLAEALGVSLSYLRMGITQAVDLEVIIEGAHQAGWDEALRRMRELPKPPARETLPARVQRRRKPA